MYEHEFRHWLDNMSDEDFERIQHAKDPFPHIQKVAYFNWLNAGKPEGRDEEFWYEAERLEMGGTAEECYQDWQQSLKELRTEMDQREWSKYENECRV